MQPARHTSPRHSRGATHRLRRSAWLFVLPIMRSSIATILLEQHLINVFDGCTDRMLKRTVLTSHLRADHISPATVRGEHDNRHAAVFTGVVSMSILWATHIASSY